MTSSDRPLQLIEELESFAPHMIREPGVDDAPAGDTGITAMLVRAMRDEHRNLVGRVGELRGMADALHAATRASVILAFFESHLSKENDLLIPALVANPNVSLGDLLSDVRELVG